MELDIVRFAVNLGKESSNKVERFNEESSDSDSDDSLEKKLEKSTREIDGIKEDLKSMHAEYWRGDPGVDEHNAHAVDDFQHTENEEVDGDNDFEEPHHYRFEGGVFDEVDDYEGGQEGEEAETDVNEGANESDTVEAGAEGRAAHEGRQGTLVESFLTACTRHMLLKIVERGRPGYKESYL